MSSNKEFQPLGDFIKLLSGNTPSKANPSYWGGTTPWVSAKDMGDFWIEDSEDHITISGKEVASRLVPSGSVLLLTRGMTLHKRVPICRTVKPATFNQDVKAVIPKAGLSARFLPYLLLGNHDRLHEKVDSAGHGTGRLNTDALLTFPVWIPDLCEQEAIADVAEALDEKIRLLRQTNATLEAIAQAMFKSWFVDFDPVRARMEGCTPEGMDEATAALFPDGFEESELGLIPRGWRFGTLGAILKLRNERVRASEHTVSLPYVPIESIGANIPFLQEYKSGQDANSSLALFRKGDVLFGAMRPYFHKVCTAPFDGVTRTTVFTLTPINSKSNAFALFQAYQNSTVDYATQHSEGSTIPYAKWKNSMELMPLLLPSESVQVAFSSVVSSFIERGNLNVLQAQTLATLRNTLIPRLISGQLRLLDAEALLEEARA